MEVRIRNTAVHVDIETLTWSVTDLRNAVATADFIFEAAQNPSLSFVPQAGDEVRVIDDDGISNLFSGLIAQVERGGDPVYRIFKITCRDFQALLDKQRCNVNIVVSSGDWYILNTILTSWNATGTFSEADTSVGIDISTYIQPVVPGFMMPGSFKALDVPVRAAIDQLISTIGKPVVWWIDANRKFHWNDVGTLAPFGLSTRPDDPLMTYMTDYREFDDSTSQYVQITADDNAGHFFTATDWVAFGDLQRVAQREADNPAKGTRNLDAGSVIDSNLTTTGLATQRAYAELEKGKVRRTVKCTIEKAGLLPGMLIDIVHDTWGTADLTPVPTISREVPAHSRHKGELAVGARGRFLVQKIKPRLKAKGTPNLYSYELELGDYQEDLMSTLARSNL